MIVEIGLNNIGDNVSFHDGKTGKIVAYSGLTNSSHPFIVNINGIHRKYDHNGDPFDENDPIIINVISRFNEKKIIQISTAMTPETDRGFAEYAVTALCDDGSVYVRFNNDDWKKLPPIPKD